MSLWGNLDAANNAPKQTGAPGLGGTSIMTANGAVMYGNTMTSAFVTNLQVGVFGVDTTEKGITTGEAKATQHAGWNLRKAGVGPVTTITANSGVYGTNAYVTFTGGGTSNTAANAYAEFDGTTGALVKLTLNSGGLYATTPTATIAGANAAITLTMGGRANRIQYETLVAMGSMYGDGNDDTQFPDS